MALYDLVQVKPSNSNDTIQGSISVTLDAPATAGNLLFIWCSPDKNVGSITLPAAFTKRQEDIDASISGAFGDKIAAGGEQTFTCTLGNTGVSKPSIIVAEFEGPFTNLLVSDAPLQNSEPANVTSIGTGSTGTLPQASGIALSFLANDSGKNLGNITWGDSFNQIAYLIANADGQPSSEGHAGTAMASRAVSSTAAISTTHTHDGTADQMIGGVVVYAEDGGGPPPENLPEYTLSGGVTGSEAKVKARLGSASTTYALEYSVNSDYSASTVTAETSTDADRIVSYDLTGLLADTQYYYRFVDNGTPVTGDYQFKTVAVGSIKSHKLGFASCYDDALGGATVFQRAAAQGIEAFHSLGDTPYIDSTDTSGATQRAEYFAWLASSDVKALTSGNPLLYNYDDHDYGLNNSDSSSPTKSVQQANYRQIFPAYDLPDPNAIYYAYTIGRVRYIALDLRSERSGSTMISATQMTWLKNEISAVAASSSLQAIVLFSTVAWIASATADTWSDASAQRTEIVDHAVSEGVADAMVICCGDAHMIAVDDGTNSAYGTGGTGGMPVFHAAPLNRANSTKGGPYSEGTFASSNGQYGILDITDTASQLNITFRGYDANDTELVSYTHSIAIEVAQSLFERQTMSLGLNIGL